MDRSPGKSHSALEGLGIARLESGHGVVGEEAHEPRPVEWGSGRQSERDAGGVSRGHPGPPSSSEGAQTTRGGLVDAQDRVVELANAGEAARERDVGDG